MQQIAAPGVVFRPLAGQGVFTETGVIYRFDMPGGASDFDVTTDGQRFLVNVPIVESNAQPLNLVLHWTAGLKK